jgi:hypothetical protein
VKRFISLLAIISVTAFAGCKDPGPAGNANSFVRSTDDIVVKSVRIVGAPENSVQSGTIYIINFTFTNHQGLDFVPKINHFIFEDADKVRHAGIDSGSTALAGAFSNSLEILKRNESRDYTAAFLVGVNSSGTIYYDPT